MAVQLETGPCIRQEGSKISGDPPPSFSRSGDERGHATRDFLGRVGDLALSGRRATGRIITKGSKFIYIKTTTQNNKNSFYPEIHNENQSYNHTDKCRGNRCNCCKCVVEDQTVRCTVTNKEFKPHIEEHTNCNTKNIIYLITCHKCKLQYVGQTIRRLKDRIAEHIYSIKKNVNNTYLTQHFNKAGHSFNDLRVQIIETIPIHIEKTKNRKNCEEIEDFWIRQLITAFPFGMNDRIKSYGDVSSGIDPASKTSHPYFRNPLITTQRNRCRRKRREVRKEDPEILEKSKKYQEYNDCCFDRHKLYVFLRSMSKKNLLVVNEAIKNGQFDGWHEDAKLATQAYMAGYYNIDKKRNNKLKGIIVVANYPNKGIELLNWKQSSKTDDLKNYSKVEKKFLIQQWLHINMKLQSVVNYLTIVKL